MTTKTSQQHIEVLTYIRTLMNDVLDDSRSVVETIDHCIGLVQRAPSPVRDGIDPRIVAAFSVIGDWIGGDPKAGISHALSKGAENPHG